MGRIFTIGWSFEKRFEVVMDEEHESLQTDDDFFWTCQYCGVRNSVWVDLTIEGKQDFIEDCRICCRPNRIIITKDIDNNIFAESRPLDE